MDAQDSTAPWWRAYSEHPPTIYDSVRAPLHEAFARAVEAFSKIERPYGLCVQSIVERVARAAVRDWAQHGYLTGETIDSLRWLLTTGTFGANLSEPSRALVLAALEIVRFDCSEAYALELLEPLLHSKAAQAQIRVDVAQPARPSLGLGCSDAIPTSWTRRDAKDAALDAFDRLGQQTTRGG